MRVAIIGGGIAGLGAAHALRGKVEIDLWAERPLGGHILPFAVKDKYGVTHHVDAGVMMFNRTEYPACYALFEALGLELGKCPLGFTVWDPARGLIMPQQDMTKVLPKDDLADVAQIVLKGRRDGFQSMENIPFSEWLAKKSYHPDTIDYALIPGIAAFWGVQRKQVLQASAAAAMREVARIRMVTRVAPSSKAYLDALVQAIGPFADRGPADRVEGTTVRGPSGEATYDRVIVATTAEVAVKIVKDAPALLRAFEYVDTTAVLHRSRAVLPPGPETPFAYARFGEATVTSWRLDLIHGLEMDGPYSATTGGPDLPTSGLIPAREIEHVFRHRHLAYNVAGEAAAREIHAMKSGPIYYAGSYFGPGGTHEPALVSGQRAARLLVEA